MNVRSQDAVLLVVLTAVEIVLVELAIRSGIAGVERATSILFVLIWLNMALVFGFSGRRKPGGR